MALSIEQILGYVPLTAAVELVATGVPKVLPEVFYRRSPALQVTGDKAQAIQYRGTRKAARIAPYGAPPRQIVQMPREAKPVRLLHSIESLPFQQELFMQLRELDSYTVQRMAGTEIAFQAQQAGERHENLSVTAVHLMLAKGKLWFDSEGNIQATSGGADLEIDYAIPAGNLNQGLDTAGNPLISASWASASTDILTQLNRLQARAVQLTGKPIKSIIYGAKIPGYFGTNDSMKQYWSRNPAKNQQYTDTAGVIPSGTAGIENWIPGQNAFWDTDDGTTTTIFGDDQIIACPDINDSTYGIYSGSYLVPRTLSLAQNVEQLLGNFEIVYGRFGYSMINLPSQIVGVYGDTTLPRLINPDAFFNLDVTP